MSEKGSEEVKAQAVKCVLIKLELAQAIGEYLAKGVFSEVQPFLAALEASQIVDVDVK